jgi:protocadherin delta 1
LLAAGSATAQEGLRYTISEEGESGVFIGDVFRDANLFSKYNGEDAILSRLRFHFLRSDHKKFVIDERTGVIQTTGPIDRESDNLPCINKDNCDIKLDVTIQPVQYFEIIKVTVEIMDINDNYPQFSERRVIHSVPESTLPESSLLTLNVQDLDSPKNSIQRFELLPSSSSMFRVTSSSQIDGSIEIKLKLQESLDRETSSEHNLRIVAYDGGSPAKTSSVDIQLLILDTNDNSPTFDSPTYEVSIPEDVQVPQAVIKVHASDPDSGVNGEITYGFTASTLKHYRDQFDIDESTGEIRLISAVDFEKMAVYTLGVTAMDKGPSAISADASVVITILDINDHVPEITISTLAREGSENAVVPENSPVGTFVSHFSVTDRDSGDNAVVSCYLDSSHFSLEFMYDNEYQMLTLTEFDREALNQYSVKILCRDNGTPPLTSETTVVVDVSDINDYAPEFEQNIYNAELIENSFEGAVATKVKAIDYDDGVNAEIVYSISDSVKSRFSIDPESGDIQARVGIDREQVKKFQFEVYAMDKGEPPRSATANVIIHIQDINDEKPIFNQPNYSFGVFENEQPGTEVGILQAEDKDSFPFNQFTYKFSRTNDAFFLDPDSGRITTRRILDREEHSVYHLIAIAADNDVMTLSSSTVSVSIYIADQNDNYPSLVFPNKVNNSVYVAKDVPYGYIVTRLNAIDMDIGNNAKITYAIVSGNTDDAFDMDYDRGTILVNKDLNVYEDVSFVLNVTAEDSGVPSFMAWSMLTITVNGSMILQPPPTSAPVALGGNNLVIVIALASTSGVITIILVMAIICIRRQDRQRDQSNGKYNCRMEALKFINITKRKKLVGGSTSSGSTSNSSDNGDSVNRSKKEVSFSMEENGADLSQDKSRKSWCSVIDHQTLQVNFSSFSY